MTDRENQNANRKTDKQYPTTRRNGTKTADTIKNEYGIILSLQARERAK